jgi:hypothetical protein
MRHDLETQLRDYTDHVVERVDVNSILEPPVRSHQPTRRPSQRGLVVAAASSLAVILLAIPVLLSNPDPTVATSVPAATNPISEFVPTPLPDPETWAWHQAGGTGTDLPTGPFFYFDSRLIALEDSCAVRSEPGCPPPAEYWWVSDDGVDWIREPIAPSLVGRTLYSMRAPSGNWLAGLPTRDNEPLTLFSAHDAGWSAVDFPEAQPGTSLPLIGSREDTVLVSLPTASRSLLAISDDRGISFESVEVPWSAGHIHGIVASPDGFGVYLLADGVSTVWKSIDGRTWAAAEDTPQMLDTAVYGLVIEGRPGRYVATVASEAGSSLWVSEDGFDWSRIGALEGVFEPGTESVYSTEFGFIAWGFDRTPSVTEDIVVAVSADGVDWYDVTDSQVSFEPGEVAMTLAGSEAGGRLFFTLVTETDDRTLWMGGFSIDD